MIVALSGNNTLAIQSRLRDLVSDFVKEHGELAIERLDGEEIDDQAVIDAVQSLPFLATKKLVIVRGLGANKAAADKIEQIISSVTDSCDLIFYEPVTDKRTVFYKTLKARTQFEEFNKLDGPGLVAWACDYAKKQAAELSYADANYLIQRLGDDQQLLANELDKLITYSPKISRQTIDLLSEKTPQSKVFDLMDAVFTGNKKRALKLYEEQRAQKVEPQAILGMLAWQLNILAVVKHGAGKQPGEIAKDLGLSPFPVSKATGLVSRLDQKDIVSLVNEAERIDRLSKTKPIDLDEALKTYIATI